MRKQPYIAFHRPLCFWNVSDCMKWLKGRHPKLAFKYANIFSKHHITGRILIEINDELLQDIGVDNFEDRQELLLEIQREKLYGDFDKFSKLSKC
ncbi:unnamed protein product [Dracunculus medinensis]|uniref:SAM domain-containing protein n=1 Tax=Dracunculus medinensis TaxID=318479 RepID=A0A158Q2I9_DRAME|nr:unnamed protein product [Dracunculus medinensis]